MFQKSPFFKTRRLIKFQRTIKIHIEGSELANNKISHNEVKGSTIGASGSQRTIIRRHPVTNYEVCFESAFKSKHSGIISFAFPTLTSRTLNLRGRIFLWHCTFLITQQRNEEMTSSSHWQKLITPERHLTVKFQNHSLNIRSSLCHQHHTQLTGTTKRDFLFIHSNHKPMSGANHRATSSRATAERLTEQ